MNKQRNVLRVRILVALDRRQTDDVVIAIENHRRVQLFDALDLVSGDSCGS